MEKLQNKSGIILNLETNLIRCSVKLDSLWGYKMRPTKHCDLYKKYTVRILTNYVFINMTCGIFDTSKNAKKIRSKITC